MTVTWTNPANQLPTSVADTAAFPCVTPGAPGACTRDARHGLPHRRPLRGHRDHARRVRSDVRHQGHAARSPRFLAAAAPTPRGGPAGGADPRRDRPGRLLRVLRPGQLRGRSEDGGRLRAAARRPAAVPLDLLQRRSPTPRPRCGPCTGRRDGSISRAIRRGTLPTTVARTNAFPCP